MASSVKVRSPFLSTAFSEFSALDCYVLGRCCSNSDSIAIGTVIHSETNCEHVVVVQYNTMQDSTKYCYQGADETLKMANRRAIVMITDCNINGETIGQWRNEDLGVRNRYIDKSTVLKLDELIARQPRLFAACVHFSPISPQKGCNLRDSPIAYIVQSAAFFLQQEQYGGPPGRKGLKKSFTMCGVHQRLVDFHMACDDKGEVQGRYGDKTLHGVAGLQDNTAV